MIDLSDIYTLGREIIQENMLTDEASVFKRVEITNELNEKTFSFIEDESYPCRVVRPSDRRVGEEGNFGEADMVTGQIEHIIKLPHTANVTRLDQIQVGSSQYEVQNLDIDKTDKLVLDCLCVLIS